MIIYFRNGNVLEVDNVIDTEILYTKKNCGVLFVKTKSTKKWSVEKYPLSKIIGVEMSLLENGILGITN